jgi:hypothetical protein
MLGQLLQLRDIVCCPGNIMSRGEHHRYSPYRENSLRPISASLAPVRGRIMSGCRFEAPQFSVAARRRVSRRDAANFVITLRADQRDQCPVRCGRLVQSRCRAWLALAPCPPLDDMARASPPLSIRITARIQWTGIADLRDAPAMKAAKDSTRAILRERAARCRRIDCREGVGQKQDCQKGRRKDTSPFEGVGRATSEAPLVGATSILSPFSKCRGQETPQSGRFLPPAMLIRCGARDEA